MKKKNGSGFATVLKPFFHRTVLTLFEQPEGVLKRRVQRVLLCHKLRQVLLALHLVHDGGGGSPE